MSGTCHLSLCICKSSFTNLADVPSPRGLRPCDCSRPRGGRCGSSARPAFFRRGILFRRILEVPAGWEPPPATGQPGNEHARALECLSNLREPHREVGSAPDAHWDYFILVPVRARPTLHICLDQRPRSAAREGATQTRRRR